MKYVHWRKKVTFGFGSVLNLEFKYALNVSLILSKPLPQGGYRAVATNERPMYREKLKLKNESTSSGLLVQRRPRSGFFCNKILFAFSQIIFLFISNQVFLTL